MDKTTWVRQDTDRAADPGRRLLMQSMLGLAAISTAPAVLAQAGSWPNGMTLRFITPSGAGAGADIFTRGMAEFFAKELGTTAIVENKPGATGMLAGEAVARGPADGSRFLVSFSAAIVGNKLMMDKLSFDPIEDLTPIGRIRVAANMLVVHPDLPVRNLKELVAYSRQVKGGLNYASWGVGSGGHLAMESLIQQTGMQLSHVPYKSTASITQDLIPGTIQVAWFDAATPLSQIKAGKLRALVCTGPTRLPQLPDVPTIAESGLYYEAHPAYGLFGHKALPAAIVQRVSQVLNRWLLLPETNAFFIEKQNLPFSEVTTPSEYARMIRNDLLVWGKLVDQAGVKKS